MSSQYVRPKKHLGQHFLTDLSIAKDIANALQVNGRYKKILEIGPGTGALTQFLLERDEFETEVVEVDQESVVYLHQHYPSLVVHEENFLKMDFSKFKDEPIAVAGNFPYNISSQILFKVLDEKEHVPEVVGMFQNEVAERVAEGPGSKTYGILSVLLQAYYDIEYLFTVPENVFNPPPKVKSGVIRLTRNNVTELPCNERLFKTVVKATFNQRRKTIRNGVKALLKGEKIEHELMQQRPEQLSVDQFVELTNLVESATS
ncbi:16S rRNA (adenine(1518)-N(6)/adenine(1519)-N(6))-dimethyltransferase RsmA [Parvicella tangerina]|uniref:Ribosomal RNA small subunit methyltransferase A n=1 Tax=Parvicella tangerina TaxID=2829795 RepID=A0A916JQN5_9FLAO|nr:16S rRNA (adenine(1518)-N(6)/adenine(1519)-N(6))-dimethyltransferase RsmA [Parvicella tangerina]CAG5086680.1 Ribosomal RNA small subunit methyltransferase A [Parvicella tangerina]